MTCNSNSRHGRHSSGLRNADYPSFVSIIRLLVSGSSGGSGARAVC